MNNIPLSSRICLAISISGWVIAFAGITYASLFISNEIIKNPHISYDQRIIFQLLSGAIGGLVCFIGAFSSIAMLKYHKDRILLAALILGFLYIVVPVLWLCHSYISSYGL